VDDPFVGGEGVSDGGIGVKISLGVSSNGGTIAALVDVPLVLPDGTS
jgi:hypothetical protein